MSNTVDKYSQAISFMNNYFSLIDGLASGLEDHLAENVILDWFGKTIRGKRNVSTFIRKKKVDSRHMFTDIKPTDTIGYKNNNSVRKWNLSESKVKREEYEETKVQNKTSNTNLEEHEINWKKIPKEEEDDMTYVLDEGDLCNLFKFHITTTDIKEVEECINRVKLEEEMAPMIGTVKREQVSKEEEEEEEEEDGFGLGQTSCEIKHVKAMGVIKFSRKYWKNDIYSKYNALSLKNHEWYQPCKLQIAYSISKERRASISLADNSRPVQSSTERKLRHEPHSKLPSLEEITSLSNHLVPNVNHFGGYLNTFDFYSDRKFFLECFRNELSETEGTSFLTGYVHDKLMFNRPTANLTYDDSNNNENTTKSVNFVFNYQIHVIIYEREHDS